MISKTQFIQNIQREVEIIKHLFDKIPEGGHDYKPTEKQRTTLELLTYLANGPYSALQVIKANDAGLFGNLGTNPVTLENFKEMMDFESKNITSLLETMSDDEMNELIDLWKSGNAYPRSQFILQMVLESFVAYKMQLFLYIKSAGNADITTSNLWQGRDN